MRDDYHQDDDDDDGEHDEEHDNMMLKMMMMMMMILMSMTMKESLMIILRILIISISRHHYHDNASSASPVRSNGTLETHMKKERHGNDDDPDAVNHRPTSQALPMRLPFGERGQRICTSSWATYPPPPNGMVPPLPRIIRILGMMLAMLGMLSSTVLQHNCHPI